MNVTGEKHRMNSPSESTQTINTQTLKGCLTNEAQVNTGREQKITQRWEMKSKTKHMRAKGTFLNVTLKECSYIPSFASKKTSGEFFHSNQTDVNK